MSQSKSKGFYSNNCLQFLKCSVPLLVNILAKRLLVENCFADFIWTTDCPIDFLQTGISPTDICPADLCPADIWPIDFLQTGILV
jgi:hypothetical protein